MIESKIGRPAIIDPLRIQALPSDKYNPGGWPTFTLLVKGGNGEIRGLEYCVWAISFALAWRILLVGTRASFSA
jgi:hypothetical protein